MNYEARMRHIKFHGPGYNPDAAGRFHGLDVGDGGGDGGGGGE